MGAWVVPEASGANIEEVTCQKMRLEESMLVLQNDFKKYVSSQEPPVVGCWYISVE